VKLEMHGVTPYLGTESGRIHWSGFGGAIIHNRSKLLEMTETWSVVQ